MLGVFRCVIPGPYNNPNDPALSSHVTEEGKCLPKAPGPAVGATAATQACPAPSCPDLFVTHLLRALAEAEDTVGHTAFLLVRGSQWKGPSLVFLRLRPGPPGGAR